MYIILDFIDVEVQIVYVYYLAVTLTKPVFARFRTRIWEISHFEMQEGEKNLTIITSLPVSPLFLHEVIQLCYFLSSSFLLDYRIVESTIGRLEECPCGPRESQFFTRSSMVLCFLINFQKGDKQFQ